MPNAGSVFKNPENDSAGRLLDKAGCKTLDFENVKIWDNHANFIVNYNKAKASDIYKLIILAKKRALVLEVMGRDAGWLTASAGLPAYFGYVGAKLIYLPEIPFSNEKFIASVKAELEKRIR